MQAKSASTLQQRAKLVYRETALYSYLDFMNFDSLEAVVEGLQVLANRILDIHQGYFLRITL